MIQPENEIIITNSDTKDIIEISPANEIITNYFKQSKISISDKPEFNIKDADMAKYLGMDLKSFLLKYSTINGTFLNEFISFINEDTLDNDLVINLDAVIKWLEVRKDHIKTTLVRSYKADIDYSIERIKKLENAGPGGTLKEKILITPNTFKKICMMTRSKKGDEIRSNYISLESLIQKYKSHFYYIY